MVLSTIVSTIRQERPSAEQLGSPFEFERLISELSSRFINLPPAEVDREIEDALRRVCDLLRIDFAVLWQWSAVDKEGITPTHAYPALNGEPLPDPGTQEHFPWVVQEMRGGRTVAVASMDELPAAAAVDRESARKSGIKSNLTLPLVVGGEAPVGALAFNILRAERDWPEVVVKRLQLVAQVFTNALARKRREVALLESEERLALAADSAEAGLWTLDYGTGAFWATERARALFGYTPDEVVTLERLEASVHPDDWAAVREAIERSGRTGEPVNEEYRIVLPGDGEVRWIISRGRPSLAATGGPGRLMGVSIDVTERKRAETALHASEARLSAGADLAGLGFYQVDFASGVALIDDRFRKICGIPPEREQGLGALEFWLEHLHPDDRRQVLEMREDLHAARIERLAIEYRFLNPACGVVWIHHLAAIARRDGAGRPAVSFGVLRDVTGRKRQEDDLRELSRRLIGAQEQERALLARELHDDVTQRLAVLAIDVGRAELDTADGAHAATLRGVREGLTRLSEDVHSLAYQLHPSVLEELGLAEALRAECERRSRQGGMAISLDLDPLPAAVGKAAPLCLFRVAQESLSNVARHAEARAADVALRRMDDGLVLAVRDDGVGFDPAHPESTRSLGLVSMRERMRLVDGTLDIESARGQGTTVIAWVPTERWLS
jgi:PAS domain S-box-containing protein